MEKNKFIIEQYSDFFRNNDCKIEIPKHIVYTGDEVFKNQDKIKKVTLHPNVKKMGTSVFEGCSNLQRVKFLGESELVVIPEKCFKNCTSIESFEIPPEVGVIKKYAFSGCTGIKHIVIPKEVIFKSAKPLFSISNVKSKLLPIPTLPQSIM